MPRCRQRLQPVLRRSSHLTLLLTQDEQARKILARLRGRSILTSERAFSLGSRLMLNVFF